MQSTESQPTFRRNMSPWSIIRVNEYDKQETRIKQAANKWSKLQTGIQEVMMKKMAQFTGNEFMISIQELYGWQVLLKKSQKNICQRPNQQQSITTEQSHKLHTWKCWTKPFFNIQTLLFYFTFHRTINF
jgi:hypothetical protein